MWNKSKFNIQDSIFTYKFENKNKNIINRCGCSHLIVDRLSVFAAAAVWYCNGGISLGRSVFADF